MATRAAGRVRPSTCTLSSAVSGAAQTVLRTRVRACAASLRAACSAAALLMPCCWMLAAAARAQGLMGCRSPTLSTRCLGRQSSTAATGCEPRGSARSRCAGSGQHARQPRAAPAAGKQHASARASATLSTRLPAPAPAAARQDQDHQGAVGGQPGGQPRRRAALQAARHAGAPLGHAVLGRRLQGIGEAAAHAERDRAALARLLARIQHVRARPLPPPRPCADHAATRVQDYPPGSAKNVKPPSWCNKKSG